MLAERLRQAIKTCVTSYNEKLGCVELVCKSSHASCLACLRVFLISSWSTTSWSIAVKSCRMLCKMKSRSGQLKGCRIGVAKGVGRGQTLKQWNSNWDECFPHLYYVCLPDTAACAEGEHGMRGSNVVTKESVNFQKDTCRFYYVRQNIHVSFWKF